MSRLEFVEGSIFPRRIITEIEPSEYVAMVVTEKIGNVLDCGIKRIVNRLPFDIR